MNADVLPNAPTNLRFDNAFARELPADPDNTNRRRQVVGACYSRVMPTPVRAPRLVAYASEVAELVGLPPNAFEAGDGHGLGAEALIDVFAGNRLLDGMDPYACCYGGHQFGNWAGQLGDGRAINLGEVLNARDGRWALQLKGAGPTPYSRTADGLAVLRSSVREFLCSEAMHHLGVPTTRALCLIETGEQVLRDMFYDGNARHEPGAVVCRVAPSFTRFGSFEIHASRNNVSLLRQLVDYTIKTDFPELGAPGRDTYLAWFEEICARTAVMIAHWMRVGFVHGVMNTDNMSVLGLTIDYGPYGWLENFDPDWTPNTTDAGGRRYRFGQQPQIALWNLVQLANAIYPLIEDVDPLRNALERYGDTYLASRQRMMADKLGLAEFRGDRDDTLFTELENALVLAETDMTLFYRALADIDIVGADDLSDVALTAPLANAYYTPEAFDGEVLAGVAAWVRSYAARARDDGTQADARRARMNAANPLYVLRNYLAQLAIDEAEKGDYALVNELLEVLRNPYAEQAGKERFAEKRPDWARHRAGCSMLSCSS
ncbi:MAG: YdiU family protein [Pseudomonadota bacterium]